MICFPSVACPATRHGADQLASAFKYNILNKVKWITSKILTIKNIKDHENKKKVIKKKKSDT